MKLLVLLLVVALYSCATVPSEVNLTYSKELAPRLACQHVEGGILCKSAHELRAAALMGDQCDTYLFLGRVEQGPWHVGEVRHFYVQLKATELNQPPVMPLYFHRIEFSPACADSDAAWQCPCARPLPSAVQYMGDSTIVSDCPVSWRTTATPTGMLIFTPSVLVGPFMAGQSCRLEFALRLTSAVVDDVFSVACNSPTDVHCGPGGTDRCAQSCNNEYTIFASDVRIATPATGLPTATPSLVPTTVPRTPTPRTGSVMINCPCTTPGCTCVVLP